MSNLLITIMVDVVPTEILTYLDPKTFLKTILTCKSLYDQKSIHKLVVKLYISTTLNISFEDIYNGKLKRIIVHTVDYICYLFLRIFDDIKIQNGSYTFHIKFVNKCKANFIKKGSDLLYIKNINMYELLFQDKYDIILPNAESFILTKTKSNIYCFKGRGFLRNNYKKGNLYVIFNLDYHKDYSKYKDCIKEIFA